MATSASNAMANQLLYGEGAAINGWVYFLGEVNGTDIKIGRSTGAVTPRETLAPRLKEVHRDMSVVGHRYVVLAGQRGDAKDETVLHRSFESLNYVKGSFTEYFLPGDELTYYINWLRGQWWVATDESTPLCDLEPVAPEMWIPGNGHSIPRPPGEHRQISFFEDDEPLIETAWEWMIEPDSEGVQDYFTPPELVDAARAAMGGIDLDAASHPKANRTHKIPKYFHLHYSAFENDWAGRVWLNPPYGNNAPWFACIERYLTSGAVSQLCMLSPMWAFTTEIAKPVMRLSSATVILSPTPKFWGNAEGRTGRNDPHAIVYFGDRVDAFLRAFAPHGIPLPSAWDRVEVAA